MRRSASGSVLSTTERRRTSSLSSAATGPSGPIDSRRSAIDRRRASGPPASRHVAHTPSKGSARKRQARSTREQHDAKHACASSSTRHTFGRFAELDHRSTYQRAAVAIARTPSMEEAIECHHLCSGKERQGGGIGTAARWACVCACACALARLRVRACACACAHMCLCARVRAPWPRAGIARGVRDAGGRERGTAGRLRRRRGGERG